MMELSRYALEAVQPKVTAAAVALFEEAFQRPVQVDGTVISIEVEPGETVGHQVGLPRVYCPSKCRFVYDTRIVSLSDA